ncbi:hypothetical protein AVEN_29768-1 [Araneus ventricosus]|uniref:Uncharacterized protein n=1 Tax=Araneus ventricosus TaxID=182803 RepID=A0A4Y2RXT0_ARAVE|nr:hypothetical protein AVEN_29768-1 [Araneus ventricosus]
MYETLCPRTSPVLTSREALPSKGRRNAAEASVIDGHRKTIVHRNHSLTQHHNFLYGSWKSRGSTDAGHEIEARLRCNGPFS